MAVAAKYGPWAVIAGASEGLGVSFAEQLAAAGINIILIARNAQKLDEVAAMLVDRFAVQVRKAVIDLTSDDMVERVAAASEDVDVGFLLYNAGAVSGPKLVIDQGREEIMHTIRLNTIGQTMLAQHFGQKMVARGRGGIVLVGSGGAHAGCYQLAVYSAVKAYTMTFAEGLWAEMQPSGVDVAALMIGRTRTPALERSEYGQDSGVAAAEPDDIARFALANLENGPVLVPPELQAAFLAMRAMPRRQAVETMTRALAPQTSK
jgi:short-subunit dehydrogenase